MPRLALIAPLALLALAPVAASAQAAAPSAPAAASAAPQPAEKAVTAAQPKQQDDARLHVNRLLEGITLTAEQRAQVDSIVQRWSVNNAMPANEPVTQDPRDTTERQPRPNEPYPPAPQAVDYTSLEAQVRSVLTPEQQRLWDANVERFRPPRRG